MNFNFQKIVIIIAIILLILALTFIGIAIKEEKKEMTFPPVTAVCPDYWEHDVANNKCDNKFDLGEEPITDKIDLNSPDLTTSCMKRLLADNLKITWEGITNNAKLDTC